MRVRMKKRKRKKIEGYILCVDRYNNDKDQWKNSNLQLCDTFTASITSLLVTSGRLGQSQSLVVFYYSLSR